MRHHRLRRDKQPDFKTLKKLSLLTPHTHISNCSVPIYVLPVQDSEFVKIDFIFNAGDFYSPKPLVAKTTLVMLQEGTTTLTSEEIAEKLDYLGAYIIHTQGKDQATISVCCLEKHLTEASNILTDCILHPTFPEEKLAVNLLKQKEQLKINLERVDFLSRQLLYQTMFGPDHPFGRPTQLEDFENITREDLVDFHSKQYVAENLKIVICGNHKSPKTKHLIDTLVNLEIPHEQKPTVLSPAIVGSAETKHWVEKDNALQTALFIGKTIVNQRHQDYAKLQVLNTVFGGYFGSRLMKNVREDKGYTYGIQSAMLSTNSAGLFVIASRVGKDVAQQAVDAIYQEMKQLRTEKIPSDELEMVKTFMQSSLARNFDGAIATSEMLEKTLSDGLDFNSYYQQYWKTISKITSSELLDLANKYLNEDSMYEVAIG